MERVRVPLVDFGHIYFDARALIFYFCPLSIIIVLGLLKVEVESESAAFARALQIDERVINFDLVKLSVFWRATVRTLLSQKVAVKLLNLCHEYHLELKKALEYSLLFLQLVKVALDRRHFERLFVESLLMHYIFPSLFLTGHSFQNIRRHEIFRALSSNEALSSTFLSRLFLIYQFLKRPI